MPNFSLPFDALVGHFESAGLNFNSDEKHKVVFFTMCGDAAVYTCRFRITHDDEVLQIDVALPVLARQPKVREQVLELVARANRGLPVGRFDLDLSDGQVTFHIGHCIGSSGLGDEDVRCLFSTAMTTVDRYFPALMRLMYGGHTAEDAVYLSELEMHSAKVSDNPKPGKVEKTAPSAKPIAKKSVRDARKKKQRPKSVAPTPDLLNPPASEGTEPTTKDRPS
jgi:hypothetical protein